MLLAVSYAVLSFLEAGGLREVGLLAGGDLVSRLVQMFRIGAAFCSLGSAAVRAWRLG